MSLKQVLNDLIKSRNGQIVTLQEIEFICKRDHYKLSNAERRLRPSESPNIARYEKNGAIIGYYWTPHKLINIPATSISAKDFLTRFPSQPIKKVKETNTPGLW